MGGMEGGWGCEGKEIVDSSSPLSPSSLFLSSSLHGHRGRKCVRERRGGHLREEEGLLVGGIFAEGVVCGRDRREEHR